MARILSILTLFLIFPVFNAHASTINEQDAAILKSSFQDILDYQKTVNEGFGTVKVVYEGALSVTQESDHYAITLPRILLKSPEQDLEKLSFDLGVIKIIAVRDDTSEGYWKTSLQLPSVMQISDGEGNIPFEISFKDQNVIGMFNDALGYFTKINMSLSDISFKANGEDAGMALGGAQVYMNLFAEEDGSFTGPGHILLSNFKVSPETNEDEGVNLGEIKLDYNFDQIVLPTIKEYQIKLLKYSDTFQALSNDENVENLNPQDIVTMFMDLYDFKMNGFGFSYSIKDAEITSANPDAEQFKIGSAKIGLEAKGFNTEEGNFSNYLSYSGFEPEENLRGIAPESAVINIRADKFPYLTLQKVFKNTMTAIAENPDSAEMAGLGIMMRLPAILSQAGTQLSVSDNSFKNDVYDLSLNGSVNTDLSAMIGFMAKFKAVFEGMDDLLARLSSDSVSDDDAQEYGYYGIIDSLEKLKTIGTKETGPNGKNAYGFVFETTPQGQFLLNGQDAMSVLNGDDQAMPDTVE